MIMSSTGGMGDEMDNAVKHLAQTLAETRKRGVLAHGGDPESAICVRDGEISARLLARIKEQMHTWTNTFAQRQFKHYCL